MKLGISVKINLSKVDKERLFKGQKGTYLDLTTFIDTDNPGEYGDHGFISQSVTKDERDQGVQTPILGNVKVFYNSAGDSQPQQQSQQPSGAAGADGFDDDIPFAPLGAEYFA